jgi:hypothetical protein
MAITYETVTNMPDFVTGPIYVQNSLAQAYKPTTLFRDKAHVNGVFPNEKFTTSPIADEFHIHQISEAGVLTKVVVTFQKTTGAETKHVAWIFYSPHDTKASTFNRMVKRNSDAAMEKVANEAFEEFIEGCPTIPSQSANVMIVAYLQKKNQIEAAVAAASSSSPPPKQLSSSVKDQKLFGQVASTSVPRTKEEVEAIIQMYGSQLISPLDLGFVRNALEKRFAKSDWNSLIKHHYDGIFPI